MLSSRGKRNEAVVPLAVYTLEIIIPQPLYARRQVLGLFGGMWHNGASLLMGTGWPYAIVVLVNDYDNDMYANYTLDGV